MVLVDGVQSPILGRFRPMASRSPPPESLSEISRRLALTRMAYGKQSIFCRLVGISTAAWNNYERGVNRISIDQAIKVCNATGATLEWIYRGRRDALSLDLATKIQTIENAEQRRKAQRTS